MTFNTPVEWIAGLFAILAIVKLIVVIFNKKAWVKNVSKPILGNKASGLLFAILAIVIFYFLILELSIVQIFAVMAFTGMIIGFAYMDYSKELMSLVDKVMKRKFSGWMWIQVIVWLVLSVWVLMELF